MSRRIVRVELTRAEATALATLAECAANTHDDALQVLDSPARVASGYRALDKLNAAIYGGKS